MSLRSIRRTWILLLTLVCFLAAGVMVGSRPAPPPAASPAAPPSCNANRAFRTRVRVKKDGRRHHPFVGMPEEVRLRMTRNSSIRIEGDVPQIVPATGDLNESTCSFSASGQGVIAGRPNVQARYEGRIEGDAIRLELTLGEGNTLPEEPIVYELEGRAE